MSDADATPRAADEHRAPAPGAEGPDPERRDAARADEVPDATFVGQPAKVMRIGTMVKQLLEEVRNAPLDEAARGRLAEVHDRSLRELEDGLSPDLVDELRRITLPFSDDANPSDAELRVAQAQLVGWLEGLFHGLQTALVAQEMSTRAQLAQMRRALPPGTVVPPDAGTALPPGASPGSPDERHPGQYL
ncbi:bacterial proteasome activator family protein [Cellulomonas sp. APG4]|uniref:bacterial proteasome activator family protein n=1 Tax=Cellulomonas sp. APG4 TaxID=1538656 RepID=UPI00137AA598|nr:bacterial proteasome activator family protein [Cellulomonas sp. APG4]NCT91783.1 bacterial proteasome activator family protein [Cellulomonas sp. APG4]